MKSLKKLFASRGNDKETNASSQTSSRIKEWSQPALTPGFYGQFPFTFSIFFVESRKDKKTDYYVLATEDTQRVSPFKAISFHGGMAKHSITLHSGPTANSAPLALAGIEKRFHSTSIIALPALAAGPGGAINQVERLKYQGSLMNPEMPFSVAVGMPGSTHQHTETFEWRSDPVVRGKPEKSLKRRLVRLSSSTETGEDIVAIWIDELIPEKSKLGTFCFQGSGATGELGQYWALMAVMTSIRISQMEWLASIVADNMIKGAVGLAGAGIGIGI